VIEDSKRTHVPGTDSENWIVLKFAVHGAQPLVSVTVLQYTCDQCSWLVKVFD
jgi:hypothetical protein